jgi:hypothetical protein
MIFYENEIEQKFIREFFITTLVDYLIYQIFTLWTKTIIFFFLIKDGKKTWWKSVLISFISAFPWAFAIFG